MFLTMPSIIQSLSVVLVTGTLLSVSFFARAQEQPAAAVDTSAPATIASTQEHPLDNNLPDHEKIWLPVEGSQYRGYYLSESSGKANGGVLLVPDLGRHPAAKGLINTLRTTLAENHWHTLAVDTSNANLETTQQIINAGIQYFNQQGVYNIAILGDGSGAALALYCVATLPPTDPQSGPSNQIRAVIMVNANNRIAGSSIDPLEAFSTLKVPILDAYSNSNYQEQQQAMARKKTARRLNNRAYQQIRLPQSTTAQQGQDNRITKRIRGWLDNNIAGFMVDQPG